MSGSTPVAGRPRRARPPTARAAAAILTTACLALLGCARGPTPSGAAGGSAYTQALAYANCMRAHHVPDWPDPNSSGVFPKARLTVQQLGVSKVQMQAAQSACRALAPTRSGPTPAQVRQYRNAMLHYARCMRAHGIRNMPDPNSRGHLDIGPGTPVDVNTPQFQAARQACLAQLPSAAGGGAQ